MFPSAVQLFLDATAGREPSARQWSRLLQVAGVEPATADELPSRLGTVFHLGAYDTAAVRTQLQVWADGMRLRGEPAVADQLQEAALSLGDAADRDAPGGSPGPGRPPPTPPAAGPRPAGRPRPAQGPDRPPRPPSRPPGHRQAGPERAVRPQPGRREDSSRPVAPQRPSGTSGPARPRPAGPGSTWPGRPPRPGDAGRPAPRPGGGEGPPPREPEAWSTGTKALLAVLVALLLATLVGLGMSLAD